MAEIEENRDSARGIDWHHIGDPLETVKQMRSVKGAKLKPGSQNWHVAIALLNGQTVDDYRTVNAVYKEDGHTINNVARSRVPDLKDNWGMPIANAYVEGKTYKEHWFDPAAGISRAREGQEPKHTAAAQPTPMAPSTAGIELPEFDWEI